MKIKINDHVTVRRIDTTWNCCKYVYRVFVEGETISYHSEIMATLKEWFGAVEYFWGDMYLCELKPNCENIKHLYNK